MFLNTKSKIELIRSKGDFNLPGEPKKFPNFENARVLNGFGWIQFFLIAERLGISRNLVLGISMSEKSLTFTEL